MRASIIAFSLVMLAACAAPVPAEGGPVNVREMVQGQHSQQRSELFELVTDPDRFNALWRLHGTGNRPTIDFDEHAVIALFMGEQPSGGHAISVAGVTRDGATLDVDVLLTVPGRGCMTIQVLTQPFAFVAVPAGPTDARFHKRREAVHCE